MFAKDLGKDKTKEMETNVKGGKIPTKNRIDNPTGRTSVRLTKDEAKAFKKWVDSFYVKADAAKELGISWPTFDRVSALHRGSPSTIESIRRVINQVTA